MNRRWLKYGVVIFISGFIIHVLILWLFYNVNQPSFYSSNDKKWAHRGYNLNVEENSLESVELANEHNYQGVEIDVWLYKGKLYVTHDKLLSEDLLTVNDFMLKFPKTKFWLDLKNLSISNVVEVNKQLKILQQTNDQFIVESKNWLPLAILSNNEINTCLWLNPNKSKYYSLYFSKQGLKEIINMSAIALFKYNAVSMPLPNYNQVEVVNRYKHLNIHLWTSLSRSSNDYLNMNAKEEVKIILDDEEMN